MWKVEGISGSVSNLVSPCADGGFLGTVAFAGQLEDGRRQQSVDILKVCQGLGDA
jgi:hypothetical protein